MQIANEGITPHIQFIIPRMNIQKVVVPQSDQATLKVKRKKKFHIYHLMIQNEHQMQ
jgi:hypothetical protein